MAIDLFKNDLRNPVPNGAFNSNMKNNFIGGLQLPSKDNSQALINLVNKSLTISSDIQKKTMDMFSSLGSSINKLSESLKKGYSNATTKNTAKEQLDRENAMQMSKILNSFDSYFKKSIAWSEKTFKKLDLLGKLEKGANFLSTETMLILAVLALKKLGLDNLSTLVKGLNESINGLKLFPSKGLNILSGFVNKGINSLSYFTNRGLKVLEPLSSKGLSYLETLKTKGINSLSSLTNRGLGFLSNFSHYGKSKILDWSIRSMVYFDDMKTIFGKYSLKAFQGLESLVEIGKPLFSGLKSGFFDLINYLGKLGGSIGDVLSKVPFLSGLGKLGKFALGKTAQALFTGYDVSLGVADAQGITGKKNVTTTDKVIAGAISAGTGFANSFLDLGSFATGKNLGTINSKGAYQFLTGTSSEYMGQNISGMAGTQQLAGVYNYYAGTNSLSGKPIQQGSQGGKKRNGKPVDNMNISSYPALKRGNRPHKGTDIAVPSGTPVYATAGGKVYIGSDPTGWGTYIQIQHSGGYISRYAHLSKLNVSQGQMVNEGDLIGLSGGNVGEQGAGNSRGAHLHYELWKGGQWLNPFGGSNKDQIAKDLSNLKPVNTSGTYENMGSSGSVGVSFGSGGNVQSVSMNSNALTAPSSSLKDLAFKAIATNEGSINNPAKLTKDNIGYTFGLSQFNSLKNPNAWKQLGFSTSEINSINSGNFNKGLVEQKLKNNINKINNLDNQQKNNLFNYVTKFAKSNNLDVSNPTVFAQLMDIANQFGQVFDNQTVSKLTNVSGSNKITLEAIKQWRMNTLQGKSNPIDQSRRFTTVNNIVGSGAVSGLLTPNQNNSGKYSISTTNNIPSSNAVSSFEGFNANTLSIKVKLDLGGSMIKEIQTKSDKVIEEQKKENNQGKQKLEGFYTNTLKGFFGALGTVNAIGSTVLKSALGSIKDYTSNALPSNNISKVNIYQSSIKSNVPRLKNSSIENVLASKGLQTLGINESESLKLVNDAGTLSRGYNTAQNSINKVSSIANALQRGNISSVYSNSKSLIGSLGNFLNSSGVDTKPLNDIMPSSNLIKASDTVFGNMSNLSNVGKSLTDAIANPNLDTALKAGKSLWSNKNALGNVFNAVTSIFGSPAQNGVIVPSDGLPKLNVSELEKKNEVQKQNSSPMAIPITSQQNQTGVAINKNTNIQDYYLMVSVSGVFD